MKFIKHMVVILALLCSAQGYAETEAAKVVPHESMGYTQLNPAQPTSTGKKIEVLEFFFYPCSHCYKLHPLLTAWENKNPKDVELIYLPTIFTDNMEPMARTFYALESLGQLKRLHDGLYKAIHEQKMDLLNEAQLTDFVVKHGVDRAKFSKAYNALLTKTKAGRSKKMAVDYGIRGTPTVIVDGKYMIYGLPPKETMQMLDTLLDKARKERAG